MPFYTGIGSRQTPAEILTLMELSAVSLLRKGWTLRSGAAAGADSAFERGASGLCEIYLPWRRFNGHPSPLYYISPAALELASRVHPNWERCSQGAKKLHARNCYQVLGADLKTPSAFVLCWHNGSGGTLQACRLAEFNKIPVHNLADVHIRHRIEEFCSSNA